jgi:glycolate oxidase FAD binding subunit
MTVRDAATIVEPADVAGVAAVLAKAAADRRPVVPVGAAGNHTAGDRSDALVLSLARIASPIDHCAGDLTATLPAGACLLEVNDTLRQGGQWLPLDPALSDRATIGGIVAANASGPRRHRYGAPRDLIIGIEMVLADGRIVKAGGRVVKNVAGYDLARLMCGSLGSLAIVTAATFKLSPVPRVSLTVVADFADAGALGALVRALSAAPVTPSAVELDSPPHRLLVRFETTPIAAEQQAGAVGEMAVARGGVVAVLADEDENAAWRAYEARMWGPEGTMIKMSAVPTRAQELFESLEETATRYGVPHRVGGRAALGVLDVRLEGEARRQVELIKALRSEAVRRGGSVVVQRAERDVLSNVDRWGDLGNALRVHQAVKQRFDPLGILNPGQGPGGL